MISMDISRGEVHARPCDDCGKTIRGRVYIIEFDNSDTEVVLCPECMKEAANKFIILLKLGIS